MNKIDSSETIRKTTLSFFNYKTINKKPQNTAFLSWFVGFTEGDGSFIVSHQRLFFIINQKDERVLYYIRTNLGFGKVSTYGNYSRYIVADRKNCDRLIELFNGNLLLHKTRERFKSWLCERNRGSQDQKSFKNRDQPHSFQDDGWLSGFVDAEGSFNAQKISDNRYTLSFRIRLRFILDQKNELSLLLSIQDFLGTGHIGIRETNKRESGEINRLTCTHTQSHQKLVEYLKKYPLRTPKRTGFLRWKTLMNYIKNRSCLVWQGKVLNRVLFLVKNINKS